MKKRCIWNWDKKKNRREILLLHRHPRMWDRAEARAVPIQEVQAALAVQIQFPMEV